MLYEEVFDSKTEGGQILRGELPLNSKVLNIIYLVQVFFPNEYMGLFKCAFIALKIECVNVIKINLPP